MTRLKEKRGEWWIIIKKTKVLNFPILSYINRFLHLKYNTILAFTIAFLVSNIGSSRLQFDLWTKSRRLWRRNWIFLFYERKNEINYGVDFLGTGVGGAGGFGKMPIEWKVCREKYVRVVILNEKGRVYEDWLITVSGNLCNLLLNNRSRYVRYCHLDLDWEDDNVQRRKGYIINE